jgi:N-acetylmuramoyl-L-alanine amidase
MRKISKIVVHCAATPPSQNIGAAQIDDWHKQRGWNGIGYHYVINREGFIQKGRPDEDVGAHVEGHNADSLGICVVGGVKEKKNPNDKNEPWVADANFTLEQYNALATLLNQLMGKYNLSKSDVYGHRDFTNLKECPSFDVHAFLENR